MLPTAWCLDLLAASGLEGLNAVPLLHVVLHIEARWGWPDAAL